MASNNAKPKTKEEKMYPTYKQMTLDQLQETFDWLISKNQTSEAVWVALEISDRISKR